MLLLALIGSTADAVRAAPTKRPTLVFTGSAAVKKSTIIRAVGRPPTRPRQWPAWTKTASRKIQKAYKDRGYSLARTWTRIDYAAAKIHIHIDEGRIARVEVRGGGIVARLSARAELALPHSVYHVATVEAGMKRLREAAPALQNAYVRVITSRELVTTPIGTAINKRFLRVFAVSREPIGLQFAAELSPRFGLDIALGYAHPNAIGRRDRLAVDLALAAPMRRYAYEDKVKLRWVAGTLGLTYRLHPAPKNDVGLALSTAISVWRDSRVDVGYLNVMDAVWRGYLGVVHIGKGPFILRSQVGAEYRHALLRIPLPQALVSPAPNRLWRLQWRNSLEIDVRPTILQRADANRIRLDALLNVTTGGTVSGRLDLTAQTVVNSGPHQFRAALDAFTTLGRAYFFEMETVAGPLQRAYFRGSLWTRRKASLEIAYRARLGGLAQIGLFHDLTVFEDLRRGAPGATLINAVGPTVNLTFLGLIAIDVSYAFGFFLWPSEQPVKWSHNVTFRLSTVF